MFWGVILESGKRYSQKVSESYHLSMACLEALPGNTKPAKKEVYVMVEHGETEYILCVLEYGRVMQEKLDIIFDCGEVVTYFLNGEGVVHLTGYALAETKDENEALANSTIIPALKANIEDDDEEDDEDWTPSKEEQKDSDSSDESEESKDEESESESEPELVKREDEMDQDQLETNEDDTDDSHGKRKKVAGKTVKSKKRKISETSPTQNGHLDEEVKTDKRKKVEANHVDAEASEDGSDSEAGESQDDDDDGIDEEDSIADDSSEEEQEQQEISSAGRTPAPNRKIPRGTSLGESPDLPQTLKSLSQKQLKNKLKAPDVSSTNKGTVPVASKNARKLAGNVQVEELRTGKGPQAKNGKLVFFHFVGKFLNGKCFEKCEAPDKPFSFRLGKEEVIKGLDIGIEGMNVGGKRRITIPPHMGYGSKGVDGIPPNTTLVFTVELKAVK